MQFQTAFNPKGETGWDVYDIMHIFFSVCKSSPYDLFPDDQLVLQQITGKRKTWWQVGKAARIQTQLVNSSQDWNGCS